MPELKPLFRRYWIKVLPNGRCISQFDPEGEYILWDNAIPATKVLLVPFSLEFAAKVREKGSNAEASNLPVLEFPVFNRVEYHRWCTVRWDVYTVCHFCGAVLTPDAKSCPRCMGRNWFYCDVCDSLKDVPKGTLLCPDCPEPRGLMEVGVIKEETDEQLKHVHVLEIDGHKHLIIDLVRT